MKIAISLLLIITSHLFSLAYAGSIEDFIQRLKVTNINGIDAALIRLDSFLTQKNKQLVKNKTQLKFIYTNNTLELSAFIKKEKTRITSNECLGHLQRIKNNYGRTQLSHIAFANDTAQNQKTAERLFAYQVLLVDQAKPDVVISCR